MARLKGKGKGKGKGVGGGGGKKGVIEDSEEESESEGDESGDGKEKEEEEGEEELDSGREQGGLKTFEGNREECKLVLVVRTDLGMGKGILQTSPPSPLYPPSPIPFAFPFPPTSITKPPQTPLTPSSLSQAKSPPNARTRP